MERKHARYQKSQRPVAANDDLVEELKGLYRALQYLERKANLMGLDMVPNLIGAAALGTKEMMDRKRISA